MRKTLQTITITALLLAPVACSPAGEADPTTSASVVATPSTPAEPTPAETSTSAEPAPEPTETETSESPSPSPSPTEAPSPAELVLNYSGLGEFQLGDTDMVDRGAMVLEPECQIYIPTPENQARGIGFLLSATSAADPNAPLAQISIGKPESGEPLTTEAGIAPGATYADVKAAYPDATEVTKQGDGGPFNTLVAVQDNLELAFLREDYSTAPLDDADVVNAIYLREHTEEMHGGC